jgi:glycosidase
MADDDAPWWQTEVLYQIYPRSFRDSNGDGVGDVRGIIERLDYLEWLGIGGIWLNPVTGSPNADWGYDVSDYKGVHPELGTMDDVEELIAEAAERGIKLIFDIVPNHTSDRHPWFLDALTGRDARYRDYYVWADPKPDGVARADRSVLPPQLHRRPARPRLVERRRARRVRRHPPVLVR